MKPLILYDNLLVNGTLSSSTLESGSNVQNIRDYRPYTFVKFAAAGTNYIAVEFGQAFAIDSIAVCGHNLYSVSAQLKLQKYTTSWIDIISESVNSNNAFMFHFEQEQASKYRIQIINSVGKPYLGVAFIGKALEMEYPPDGPRSIYNESIIVDTEISKGGNLLGNTIRFNPIEINHNYSNLSKTFVQNSFITFWNYAKTLKPFFYAIDLTNNPNDIFYVRLKEDSVLDMPQSNLNYVDMISLKMTGQR